MDYFFFSLLRARCVRRRERIVCFFTSLFPVVVAVPVATGWPVHVLNTYHHIIWLRKKRLRIGKFLLVVCCCCKMWFRLRRYGNRPQFARVSLLTACSGPECRYAGGGIDMAFWWENGIFLCVDLDLFISLSIDLCLVCVCVRCANEILRGA